MRNKTEIFETKITHGIYVRHPARKAASFHSLILHNNASSLRILTAIISHAKGKEEELEESEELRTT